MEKVDVLQVQCVRSPSDHRRRRATSPATRRGQNLAAPIAWCSSTTLKRLLQSMLRKTQCLALLPTSATASGTSGKIAGTVPAPVGIRRTGMRSCLLVRNGSKLNGCARCGSLLIQADMPCGNYGSDATLGSKKSIVFSPAAGAIYKRGINFYGA